MKRVDAVATEIDLDAVGFSIESVKVDGKIAEHRYDGRSLAISLAKNVQNATIAVAYRATPRRGLYFLEPDEHVPDRPRQVWSQCQEEDARHWLPCHDKPHVKMTTEISVTAPSGWSVLGNGELTQSGPKFTWKMSEPHPSYLLTLVAGEFSVLEAEADGVPLTYWVPKGREEDAKRTFEKTPEMVKHFGQLFGVKYPWNKYAQVVVSDFIFGGMENTTATTLYEHTLLDTRASLDISSDDLIAHELAHQWFGDYVTCRDWSEGWLNEGFATFIEHVWREKDLGRDEYEYGLQSDLEGYVGEAHGRYRRAIVCQDYDSPLDLFDRHLYEKGGLVLHILRTEVGDEVFWRGIAAYLNANANGIVETRDLMRSLEKASGRSLGKLFEQWVHRPGHAELDVALSWDDGALMCDVKQTHHTAPASNDSVPNAFELTLTLDMVAPGANGATERRKLHVTQRAESFAVPCAVRPQFVVVDADARVLGEVTLKAPGDMLRNQLKQGRSARARWLAAQSLARVDDPPTIEALAERLRDDKEFWGVRNEAATALSKIRGPEAYAVLAAAAKVKHPKVRRAVAAALGAFKTQDAFEALKPLALGDESYLVQSDAARALGKTKQPQALDVLLDVVDRKSWSDVVSVGALDGMAAMRDERAVPHVVARTRYGHPTRARRAAILALPKIASDRRARETLEDLLDDRDPYLRVDAVRALAEVGDAKARPALRTKLESDLDPRVRRRIREALRDLGGEGKRANEALREELDKVRGELAEVRARVAKVEARNTPAKKPTKKKR